MRNRKPIITDSVGSIAICILAVLVCSCGGDKAEDSYVKLSGIALGTSYHITVNQKDTVGIYAGLNLLFEEVENSMSVYRENSLINRLNRNETDSVDSHIAYCIGVAREVSILSGGEYDITIRPITSAWGFNAEQREKNVDIDSLLRYVGYGKIAVNNGRLVKQYPEVQIELNSIAKGYTVDLTGKFMDSRGIADYLVEIGGEIVCRGVNPSGGDWTVGIDSPVEGNNIWGGYRQAALSLADAAMATSGNYRKFLIDETGRKVVHTFNARTGGSQVSDLLSATVVAADCAHADAYATMLMVVGLERAKEFLRSRKDMEGYLIYSGAGGKFEEYVSPGLEKSIIR